MEHTIDQLARRAGKDPADYRRALYRQGRRRGRAISPCSTWPARRPAGASRPTAGRAGVAVHESFGSVVAQVAEVNLEDGDPRVGRVVTAIDCGIAISPDQIAAQMEGGTCFGLSAALYGQITLKDGVPSRAISTATGCCGSTRRRPSRPISCRRTAIRPGVGEPGTPLIAPALANALLVLTGQPTTSLPFVKA